MLILLRALISVCSYLAPGWSYFKPQGEDENHQKVFCTCAENWQAIKKKTPTNCSHRRHDTRMTDFGAIAILKRYHDKIFFKKGQEKWWNKIQDDRNKGTAEDNKGEEVAEWFLAFLGGTLAVAWRWTLQPTVLALVYTGNPLVTRRRLLQPWTFPGGLRQRHPEVSFFLRR